MIDRRKFDQIHADVQNALDTVAKKHGLTLSLRPRADSTCFRLAAEMQVTTASGEPVNYRALAKAIGVPEDSWGKVFDGGKYRVTGISPSRPNYPIDGEAVRSGKKYKFKVEQAFPELRVQSIHSLFGSTVVKPSGPRTEADIMQDIDRVYGDLSPENLTCDGELSATEVRKRSAELNRKLRLLFVELGRQVSEMECHTWLETHVRPFSEVHES